jgi:MFS family permease
MYGEGAENQSLNILTKIKQYPKIGLVLLAYVAFIALGMPDGLLGVAWPSIRTSFSIPLDAIGMLLTASVAGYMTSSFLSGPLITRLGVGRVLAASCAMTGVALHPCPLLVDDGFAGRDGWFGGGRN